MSQMVPSWGPWRYLRIMFAVDDIDGTLARLGKHGAHLVSSEVVRYEDAYRLCYIRGPDGFLIGLAEQTSQRPVAATFNRSPEVIVTVRQ